MIDRRTRLARVRAAGLRATVLRATVLRATVLRATVLRATVLGTTVLTAAAFFCVCALAMACLASCERGKPNQGTAVHPAPSAFLLGKAIREASPLAPVLFTPEGDVRQRGIERIPDGYLYWDHAGQRLIRADARGKTVKTEPLKAAFAWVTGNTLLAREDNFSDGEGFRFTLYRYDGKLKETWSGFLDCFPSDVLIRDDGIAFIAGGNRDNSEKAVYRIRAGTKPVKALAMPISRDFLRLVGTPTAIVAFASGREKERAALELYELADPKADERAFAKVALCGFPPDALDFYGYGFSYLGDPVVPVAMEDGSISLARLGRDGDGFSVVSLAHNSGGCILPLGNGDSGDAYTYLAHDGLADGEWYGLGAYNGNECSVETIK